MQLEQVKISREELERYPWPAIMPPPEHPRVLLRNNNIDELKRHLLEPKYKQEYLELQALADDESISAELPPEIQPGFGNFSMRALHRIDALALLGLLEGRPDYSKQSINMLRIFLERVVYADQKLRHDVTRNLGRSILSIALVYDFSYHCLSDDDKEFFIEMGKTIAFHQEVSFPPFVQGAVTGHAGEAQLLRDQLSFAIAVYDEAPEIYRVCAGRVCVEFTKSRNFFYPSGRHHQGDCYGPYRFEWELWTSWLFKRMSGQDVFVTEQGLVPYNSIYIRRPDGQLFRQGDSYHNGYNYWDTSNMFFLAANYYNNPYFKDQAILQGEKEIKEESPALYLIMNNFQLEARPVDELPLTRFFGNPLPAMVARTSWDYGRLSQTCAVEMRGSHTIFANHAHLDAGSFQIYYKGGLAIDSGTYAGCKYANAYDWAYNKQTIAHNAMLAYDPDEIVPSKTVNAGGQRFSKSAKEVFTHEDMMDDDCRIGDTPAVDFGPDKNTPYFSYLKCDLSQAYTDKVSFHEREMCFIRFDEPGRPGMFIVHDRMETMRPNIKKYFLLHTLHEPEVSGNRYESSRHDEFFTGKLSGEIVPFDQTEFEFEKFGGDGQSGNVFGTNYEPIVHSSESNAWRLQISPRNPSKSDRFLNVMQILDHNVEPYKVSALQNEYLSGVQVNDNAVLFADSTPQIDADIRLDLEPVNGLDCKVLIYSLTPGCWIVSEPDGPPAGYNVEDGVGTLLFSTKSPQVTITYAGPVMPEQVTAGQSPEFNLSRTKKQHPYTFMYEDKTLPPDALHRNEEFFMVDPMRLVSEFDLINCEFSSDSLTVSCGTGRMRFTIGSDYAELNGVIIHLPAACFEQQGKFFCPLRSLAALLDCSLYEDMLANEAILYRDARPESERGYKVYALECNKSVPHFSPWNMFDGSLNTYWAAHGVDIHLVFDLLETKPVGSIDIQWRLAKKTRHKFSVELSEDGENWTEIFNGVAVGEVNDHVFEHYEFAESRARYVKLNCMGSTRLDSNYIINLKINP